MGCPWLARDRAAFAKALRNGPAAGLAMREIVNGIFYVISPRYQTDLTDANCESFLHLIFDRIGGGRGSVCATGHCFDAIFRSELTEGRHTPGVTAIRALRMQKDQLQVGHTIHPSDSGRQASERPPCCHKESAAAYP